MDPAADHFHAAAGSSRWRVRLKLAAQPERPIIPEIYHFPKQDISYGFRNRDVNGTISLERKYNPFKRVYHLRQGEILNSSILVMPGSMLK